MVATMANKQVTESLVAYTSTGVRIACVKEQQAAPEKAYLAMSDNLIPDSAGTGERLATPSATYFTALLLPKALGRGGEVGSGKKILWKWLA